MDITDFLAAGPNLPFLITGCVVGALLTLTIVSLIFGVGHDLFHADIDVTLDANGNGIPDYLEGGHGDFFAWVNPAQIPSTVFLILFCGIYSILGYSGQWIYDGIAGALAPMAIAGPVALAITLPIVRGASMAIAPVLPKDETNAVSLETLIGSAGILSAGPIDRETFGIARFTDSHGTDHNLMVSGEGEETIANGSPVVLIGPHRERTIAFVVRKI